MGWGVPRATRLIFYDGELTAPKYRDEILSKAKLDFKVVFGAHNRNWTFTHDGASAHKAKSTTSG